MFGDGPSPGVTPASSGIARHDADLFVTPYAMTRTSWRRHTAWRGDTVQNLAWITP
jgi:hypothetical protein